MAKTVQSVRTVGNVSLLVLGNPVAAQDASPALGFGVSVARAITERVRGGGRSERARGAVRQRRAPGLESRGVLRLAGRYTHGLLRFDVGVLVGITPRDPVVRHLRRRHVRIDR